MNLIVADNPQRSGSEFRPAFPSPSVYPLANPQRIHLEIGNDLEKSAGPIYYDLLIRSVSQPFEVPMASKQTILLIEDDREIQSTLLRVLESAGYEVMAAANGVEGRRLADSRNPNLVITDMMMPKMGGFPVLEHLKSLPTPPKVIMITANEGGRHKAYAEMLGVDDYLRKPFDMSVLLDAVKRALTTDGEKKA